MHYYINVTNASVYISINSNLIKQKLEYPVCIVFACRVHLNHIVKSLRVQNLAIFATC